MTPRIVIAIVFLLAALSLSVFSTVFITASCRELGHYSDDALENTVNGDFSRIPSLCNKWQEKRLLFCVLLKHSDADALDRCFLELEKAYSYSDEDAMIRIFYELSTLLDIVSTGEKLNCENIF